MKYHRFPVFISYRHSDTADKAEHLLTLLEASGYEGRVSFDRENLDGRFDLEILRRLDDCTDFIVILGTHTLDGLKAEESVWYDRLAKCSVNDFQTIEEEMKSEGIRLDFVRFEIARALAKEKHIIPIVPVPTADYNFDELKLPGEIQLLTKQQAEKYQDSKDFLFKEVTPKVKKRLKTAPDNKRWVKFIATLFAALIVAFVLIVGVIWNKESKRFQQCRTQADYESFLSESCVFYERECGDSINAFERLKGSGFTAINDAMNTECTDSIKVKWNDDCSLKQIRVLKRMINNMMYVPEGEFVMGREESVDYGNAPHKVIIESAFYMGKFEVSELEWNTVMNDSAVGEEELPMSNVTWEECQFFVRKLQRLTGLMFSLPTEEEWEYAARYGEESDWRYAGGNSPEEVATFEENSGGKVQQRGKHSPNAMELYDMSGNVAELCSNGDCEALMQIIRGGSYKGDRETISTTYSDAVNVDSKLPEVGLRLVLK